MLRIHHSKTVGAAKSYYNSGLAQGDYYGQEVGCGVWAGKAAGVLGLSGDVEKDDFSLLCDNRRPDTLGKLNPREDLDRRCGCDLTWAAPKSVSILYSVFSDERVLSVFQKAVRDTMLSVEESAYVRVRKGGVATEAKTGNLVWAEFTHLVSRPVFNENSKRMECDPALHCHAYTFNTTLHDARFQAVDLYHVVKEAPYFQAAFHSRLAMGLKELGYEIINKKFGFEVRGVSQALIDEFSKRSEEIEHLAEELGIAGDKKAMDGLASRTRNPKITNTSKSEMRNQWLERANRVGDDYDWDANESIHVDLKQVVDQTIDSMFERDSVMQYRRLIAEVLQNSLGSCTVEEVEDEIAGRDELIISSKNNTEYVTTKLVLEEENKILKFLARTKGTQYQIHSEFSLQDSNLDDEQKSVVEALMRSKDRVFVVAGKAGTGKTTMMKAAIDSMMKFGERVYTFAPTSQASHQVLKQEGFENSETIQQFLLNTALQEEASHAVLWVDEAGMLSAKELSKLFEISEKYGNRIVLSGDVFQHKSVGRGSLRLVTDSGLVEVKETRTIYRQKLAQYKEAVECLSVGNVIDAVEIFDEMGAIKEYDDLAEKLKLVAQDYVDGVGKNTLVVSPSHAEGRLVTSAIREKLKSIGYLSSEEKEVISYRNKNLTDAQKQMAHFLEVGNVICFHKGVAGVSKRGESYKIEAVQDGQIILSSEHSEALKRLDLSFSTHFEVFEQIPLKLVVNDKIRFTKNVKSIEGKRIYNGSVHQVKSITDTGEIELQNGSKIAKGTTAIAYGYVSTSHASQGKTTQKVIICQGAQSQGAESMEQFYVSASRAREEISIWVENKADFIEGVSRSRQGMLAQELLEQKRLDETQQELANRVTEVSVRSQPQPATSLQRGVA